MHFHGVNAYKPLVFNALTAGLTAVTLTGIAACAPGPERVTPSPSPAGILHQKGPYQAYYGPDGKIERLLQDIDGDGRADAVILYWPSGKVRAGEIDSDRDGTVDRWEYYSTEGVLEKLGTSRKAGPQPDHWDIIDQNGRVVRQEFDDDGDGVPDGSQPVVGETLSSAPTRLESSRK